MRDTSKMPARIWITAEDRSASWAGSFTRWHASDLDHGDEYPVYHRADIVERLAKALDGLVQRFDTFDGQPFVNPADSPWAIARSALAAYRESINDEA